MGNEEARVGADPRVRPILGAGPGGHAGPPLPVLADRTPSAERRAGVYRLLARVFLKELDAEAVELLGDLPELGRVLPSPDDHDALARLRAEFARLFLVELSAHESLYLDDSGMLNTARTAKVLETYRRAGYEPPPDAVVGAADHIALELDFMAFLAALEAEARRAGDRRLAAALRGSQASFLGDHLAAWAPLFCAGVEDSAGPLYAAASALAREWLLTDLEALASSVAQPTGG